MGSVQNIIILQNFLTRDVQILPDAVQQLLEGRMKLNWAGHMTRAIMRVRSKSLEALWVNRRGPLCNMPVQVAETYQQGGERICPAGLHIGWCLPGSAVQSSPGLHPVGPQMCFRLPFPTSPACPRPRASFLQQSCPAFGSLLSTATAFSCSLDIASASLAVSPIRVAQGAFAIKSVSECICGKTEAQWFWTKIPAETKKESNRSLEWNWWCSYI